MICYAANRSSSFCRLKGFDNFWSFMGMVQVFNDRTATTEESCAIVMHPVQDVLLIVTTNSLWYSTDHVQAHAKIFPVSVFSRTQNTEDNENIISEVFDAVPAFGNLANKFYRRARDLTLEVMNAALCNIFSLFSPFCYTGFHETGMGTEWNCFLVLVSSCYDTAKETDASSIMHRRTILPFIRCFTSIVNTFKIPRK